MQIQLKQKEIEAALRGYIIKQGINMEGRTLSITFTSGRKDNGLSADLNIEDEAIPGFSKDDRYDEYEPAPKEEEVVPSPAVLTALKEEAATEQVPPAPAPEEKKSLQEDDLIDEDATFSGDESDVASEDGEPEPVVEVRKPLNIFG